MATVKAFAKTLLKNLTFLAGIYVCFRYLGDFTSRQSAVLTITAWVGYRLFEKLKNLHTAADAFSPFSACIRPDWHKLLSDFKLIRTEDEWRKLCEAVNKMPGSEYTALRHGFTFTVIKPPGEDGFLPGLTFWGNRKVFLTEVEFSEPVMPIETDWSAILEKKEHPFFHHPKGVGLLPTFCFKSGIEGYEIGLEVNDDWWERLKESKEIEGQAKIKEDRDHLCGTTRLVIATLPYSEFGLYYQRIDYNNDYDRARKFLQKFERARDMKLDENGWKRRQGEFDSEVPDPWSHVEHKYVTVSHRSI
jgi:hypothetical protein